VSVVYMPDLTQLTAVEACDMPHGSRVNRAGTQVYIACMMSDELLTIDPGSFAVSRRVRLGTGTMSMAGMDHSTHTPGAASSTMPGQNPDCMTTYVSVAPNDSLIYLACNHSNRLEVRDGRTLALVRSLETGNGAYNVEPSPDGRWVVVTNKKAQSISVFDTRTWTATVIPTSKRIPHGVAFSPDGRYAFITCESIGSDPGALDAIDLTTMRRVASMELRLQPTGIAVWRSN
jgi:DNA-binding beta-propeller fold protein YncE